MKLLGVKGIITSLVFYYVIYTYMYQLEVVQPMRFMEEYLYNELFSEKVEVIGFVLDRFKPKLN
jgi:hypothetical protein